MAGGVERCDGPSEAPSDDVGLAVGVPPIRPLPVVLDVILRVEGDSECYVEEVRADHGLGRP